MIFSVLEERLKESFGAASGKAEALSVDAIQFVDEDAAWTTTTLRLRSQTEAPESFRTLMVRERKTWYGFLSETLVEDSPSPDAEPIPIFEPPDPEYPRKAREKRVSGEVVLQVAVELDGSTTVLRVVKSVPYCDAAAIENARRWRWKPAVKDGAPVRAYGLISVAFNIFERVPQ